MRQFPPLIIKPSLLKSFGLLLASVTLTAASLWILTLDPLELAGSRRVHNPTLLYVIAALGMVLFGSATLAVPISFWSGRQGLRLDSAGLHSHSWGGLLAWHEIASVSPYLRAGQKMLLIHLHEPTRQFPGASRLRRSSMRRNLRNVGTPVVLSSNTLRVGFHELYALIAERHAHHHVAGTAGDAAAL